MLFVKYLSIISLLLINLYGADSFEFNFDLTIKNKQNKIIHEIKNEYIDFIDNNLNKKIKFEKVISKSLPIIQKLELEYKDEELFEINTLKDALDNTWTFSTRVLSDDTSVTHFVSLQADQTIEGWINRNNKDIFGLRILNF